jgi:hypothetical protein
VYEGVQNRPRRRMLHNVARWQLARNGYSFLSSLRYCLFELSLRAMYRTDRNACFCRNGAHTQAGCQEWCDGGASGMFHIAGSRRCESGVVGAHDSL